MSYWSLTGGIGMGKSTAAQMSTLAIRSGTRMRRIGFTRRAGDAVAPVAAAFPGVAEVMAASTAPPCALCWPTVPMDFKPLKGSCIRWSRPTAPLSSPGMMPRPSWFWTSPALRDRRGTRIGRVAVVSAPPAIQRARVMARPGMTEENFQMILSRQMPDSDKRKRADWVIPSDTMDGARAAIMDICAAIMAG